MIRASSINITSQLLNLIAELDEFNGRWEMLGRLAPEKLTSLAKFRAKFKFRGHHT